ncbi:hypothetical protein Q4601_21160 [Shewanella sp. 1_MG-2023]|uniref:hypothetical protein n=1 Tax=unclassified Shewanella TaxID=196818 RepID=UPI0026E2BFC2|nr:MULTISPECIES: hypothetical protein [unclassified Shewanella]MDO6613950.1 hypothetical protein [Shewanella sp. 7_MG-2023]MDO6773721.1 hypothetical protein [Shewanella sp. 2_MG-2023]MDO6796790.1 hypothetical protein [Shewanella sp. 1_MG-2023]
MKFSLFILFFTISFFSNAEPQALRLSKYIGNINMYDVTFSLVDTECNTSYSLTKKQIEEIDKLTIEKTRVSYKKFNSIVGDPALTLEMSEESIQPILDSNCNSKLLEYWYSKVSKDFNKNLSNLRNEEPTSVQIK